MELVLIYLAGLFLVTLVSMFYYYMAFSALFKEEKRRLDVDRSFTPRVTVQIPVYNDRIVERLIRAVLSFDYPNYEIVIADDSTDIVTRRIIDSFASHPLVTVVRRNSRDGFKAGALMNALKYSTGEIIVVFDSDFVPPKDFLWKIVQPFKDPRVGYVQARWVYENLDENLITVFAGTALSVYHRLVYPFQDRTGIIYLSGSAMAIRRSALEEVGGWVPGTLAEDAELTHRLAIHGYRSVYLGDLEAPNQLPFTLKVFIRQQIRWSAGMIEALVMNWRRILGSNLPFSKKTILILIPAMNLLYVVVAVLSALALLFWAFNIHFFSPLLALSAVFLTSGYVVAGYFALRREGYVHAFPRFLVSVYILGPLVAVTNTLGILRWAIFRVPWYVTPKRWGH